MFVSVVDMQGMGNCSPLSTHAKSLPPRPHTVPPRQPKCLLRFEFLGHRSPSGVATKIVFANVGSDEERPFL